MRNFVLFREKLPVPDGITKMFSNKTQHVDHPEEHGGRIRTFAHERGNWASFVYADSKYYCVKFSS